MQRRNRIGMLAGVITLALTSSVLAQRTTADITGTVTDTTGAILPGASVTAVCPETNLTRTAVSDAQGGYRLAELPICVYKMTVELSGFKSVSRETPLAANAVAKADFRLEVGTMSETVTVEGVSPLIEFSDKLNNRIEAQRIEEIPPADAVGGVRRERRCRDQRGDEEWRQRPARHQLLLSPRRLDRCAEFLRQARGGGSR